MFTPGPGSLNYWRIANTSASSMPARLSATGHGKALWFGHPTLGSYRDPEGGAPEGSVTSIPLDLRSLSRPVLSFASYYETQDLGLSLDRKRVEVLDATSGAVLIPYPVSGEAGGYAQWRTQTVDLGAFATRIVQLRFVFETVTNQSNQYLGWLVDDIVVGSDWDADKLPDKTEVDRQLTSVSYPLLPLDLPDGSTRRYYVAPPAKTSGGELSLKALIRHAQTSQLVVVLGVELLSPGTAPKNSRVVIFDGASGDTSSCRPSGLAVFRYTWFHATHPVPGGLQVSLNPRMCGLAPEIDETQYRWYLEVKDAGGGGSGTLEYIWLIDQGRTAVRIPDVDHDGSLDGDESLMGTDPLGVDIDRDGDPDATDANPFRPNWVPAMAVGSTTWGTVVEIRLEDLRAPMFVDSFNAKRGTTPVQVTVAASPGASHWRLNIGKSAGQDWDALSWRAVDVHGTRVVYTLRLSSAGQPDSLEAKLSGTGLSQSFTKDLSSYAPSGTLEWVLVHQVSTILPAGLLKEAIVLGAAYTFRGMWLGQMAKLYPMAEVGLLAAGAVAHSAWRQAHVENAFLSTALGRPVQFLLPTSVRQDAVANRGFASEAELVALFEQAQVFVNTEPRHMTRWIKPVAGAYAFYVAYGPVIVEAWKIPAPTSVPEWVPGGLVPLASILSRELWGSTNLVSSQYKMEHSFCASFCKDRRGLDPTSLTPRPVGLSVGGQDGSETEREPLALALPADYIESLAAAYRAFDHAGKSRNHRVTDATVAQLSLIQVAHLARNRELASETTAYWDDAPGDGYAETDCDDSNANRLVRRCASPTSAASLAGYDPPTWMGDERMDGLRVDWLVGPLPQFSDRIVAKGRVYQEQQTPARDGQTLLGAFQGLFRERLSSNAPSTVDGDIWVAYDLGPGPGETRALHLSVKRFG